MNLIEQIQQDFITYITRTFSVDAQQFNQGLFSLNTDEAKQDFGTINSNIAMVLAKQLGKSPREIAQQITAGFSHLQVEKIEIAGPGFLNFFLKPDAFKILAENLFQTNENFFKPNKTAELKKFNLEYVSANPTGPLHFGHGRGAVIGDVLANVLEFLGHSVTREFYINDAGAQIEKLGHAFKIRCQQELGQQVQLPEDSYHGEYLIELARMVLQQYGPGLINNPDSFFQTYAKNHLLEAIKNTLSSYGITYNIWFSEKTLHDDGSIDRALELLNQKGFLYEADGALWFKSTAFGDDKDRVVRKKDGSLTYVAADIAYMKNKIDRGAQHLIMVLGHDHHSYVTRLQGLLKALDLGPYTLDVILYQLVKMKASGQLVRMSKRAGNIVTLSDIIELVGSDVARFFYLNRKADAQLEFDVDLALKKTEENPVFYVQYAYVRINSILAKAQEVDLFANINAADVQHIGHAEQLLITKVVSLKPMLETISQNHQTHVLTYYALELAKTFHGYYAKNRVIEVDQVNQSRGRLFTISLIKQTLETVLKLLEISRPQKM